MSTSKPSRTCSKMRQLLAQRVDAPLSSKLELRLEQHLASCTGCAAIARQLERVDELAAAAPSWVPDAEHYAHLTARIVERVGKARPVARPSAAAARRWPRWTLPVLAPSAALALLLLFVLRQGPPSPVLEATDAPQIAQLDAQAPSEQRLEAKAEADAIREDVDAAPELKERADASGPRTEQPELAASRRSDASTPSGPAAEDGLAGLSSPAPTPLGKDERFAPSPQALGRSFAEPVPAAPSLSFEAPPAPPLTLRDVWTQHIDDPDDRLLRALLAALPAGEAEGERLQEIADAQPRAKLSQSRDQRIAASEAALSFADSVRIYLHEWLLRNPTHALADSVRAAVE